MTKESVDAALGKIDGFVQAEMDEFGVPGVAVAVVYDDEVVFSKGYGIREIGKPETIDTDTVFQIASLSKPVTATAIAGLVGKQVIEWDDPVKQYNPDLTFSDPWVTDHVTFADLYSHRSGLPGGFGNGLETMGYTRDEILSRLQYIPLNPFRASVLVQQLRHDGGRRCGGQGRWEVVRGHGPGAAVRTGRDDRDQRQLRRLPRPRQPGHHPCPDPWRVGARAAANA